MKRLRVGLIQLRQDDSWRLSRLRLFGSALVYQPLLARSAASDLTRRLVLDLVAFGRLIEFDQSLGHCGEVGVTLGGVRVLVRILWFLALGVLVCPLARTARACAQSQRGPSCWWIGFDKSRSLPVSVPSHARAWLHGYAEGFMRVLPGTRSRTASSARSAWGSLASSPALGAFLRRPEET